VPISPVGGRRIHREFVLQIRECLIEFVELLTEQCDRIVHCIEFGIHLRKRLTEVLLNCSDFGGEEFREVSSEVLLDLLLERKEVVDQAWFAGVFVVCGGTVFGIDGSWSGAGGWGGIGTVFGVIV